MEEQARKNFAAALTIFCGIAYFFAVPRPLPKVLELKPVWASSVVAAKEAGSPLASSTGELHPFSIGSTYGFFDFEKGATLVAERSFGLSMAQDSYIVYDRLPADLTWRGPDGRALFVAKETGYPFMAGGRRFVLAPDQSTVSEIGPTGEALWRRSFPSILTAFDASPSLALFGTLDGQLIGLAPDGSERLSFAPGGSRIACIMGCAVSPDGQTVAAISGVDKQRLVVLERRAESFRVSYHRWLDSDYRRPVSARFTTDGGELLFENPSGLSIYDVARRSERSLKVEAIGSFGSSISERKILLILESGPKPALTASALDGRREFTFPFDGEEMMLTNYEDKIFMGLRQGGAETLLRLDFGED